MTFANDEQRPRKLVDLRLTESSAVDHPAHLSEGWLVLKSKAMSDDEIADILEKAEEVGRAQSAVRERQHSADGTGDGGHLSASVSPTPVEKAERFGPPPSYTEWRLHQLAEAAAQTDGTPYYLGLVKAMDSAEGRREYEAMRANWEAQQAKLAGQEPVEKSAVVKAAHNDIVQAAEARYGSEPRHVALERYLSTDDGAAEYAAYLHRTGL